MLPCLFLAFESKKIVKCVQGTQKFIIFATNIHLVNKVMAITITIIALIAIFIVAWFMGLNANLGIAILDNCFPTTYPCKGEQVDVYINGSWNRCATVTACCHDFLVLYGAVRCPIDYRGRFYAIGVDANDNTLVYVDKVHWHLVKRAELIRKICNVPDEYGTFPSDDETKPYKDLFPGVKDPGDEVPEIPAEEE